MKAWIARDYDGSLWFYSEKPCKELDVWGTRIGCAAPLDSDSFPSVKWEDDEPTEVEITIKPKKRCEN